MAFKNTLNLMKVAAKVGTAIKNTSPKAIAKIAKDDFQSNFDRGGFDGKRWKRTKKKRGKTLKESGRLQAAIVIAKAGGGTVVINNRLPYATIHNEGGRIKATARVGRHSRRGRSVKAHTRKMDMKIPKRQFMGTTKRLNKKIRQNINRNLKNAFR